MEEPQSLFGITSTSWSAIAIFVSVFAALFGENIKNFFKKKEVLKSLQNEFNENIEKLKEIKELELAKTNKEKYDKLKTLIGTLNTEAWTLNKSFLSIISPHDFDKYNKINSEIEFIKGKFLEMAERHNLYWADKSPELIRKEGLEKDFNKIKKEIERFLNNSPTSTNSKNPSSTQLLRES